jgi:DNA-binding NtrC family response regulator
MAKIVVIDDEPAMLRIAARTLEAAGYMVAAFANGRRGVDYFKTDTADLLITDIFMPEMEGLETIQTAHRMRPEMPIIAMSGVSFDGGDYLRIAERFGAIATLKKPFRRSELLALVSRLLAPAHH